MAFGYPSSGGFLFSHKSLTITEGPNVIGGCTSLSLNPKIDGSEPLYATGTKALGFPRGNFICDVELEFAMGPWADFITSYPGYLSRLFTFTFVYQEGDQSLEITVEDLRFTETDMSSSDTEASKVSLTGQALDIKINGESMADGDAFGSLINTLVSIVGGLI